MTSKSVTRRFTLEMSDSLFRQVDAARGDVPRNRWIRRAVERALGEADAVENPPRSTKREKDVVPSPAPAEQSTKGIVDFTGAQMSGAPGTRPYRQHVAGPNVENVRSSGQAKDFKPYPKEKKR